MYLLMRKLQYTKYANIRWNKDIVGDLIDNASNTLRYDTNLQTRLDNDPINAILHDMTLLSNKEAFKVLVIEESLIK